jgi:hypothetical protein
MGYQVHLAVVAVVVDEVTSATQLLPSSRPMQMELLKLHSLLEKSSYQELYTQNAVVVNLTVKIDNVYKYKSTTRLNQRRRE